MNYWTLSKWLLRIIRVVNFKVKATVIEIKYRLQNRKGGKLYSYHYAYSYTALQTNKENEVRMGKFFI